jgi:hypothetical protein
MMWRVILGTLLSLTFCCLIGCTDDGSDVQSTEQGASSALWSPWDPAGARVFDVSDLQSWEQDASSVLWSPRDSSGELVFDGKMWIFGGYTPDRINDVWCSANGIDWTQVTDAADWSGRNLMSTLVYSDRMWVLGGFSGPYYQLVSRNDVWYSQDGANWTQATASAPWAGRGAMSAAVFKDQMWIMGGFQAENYQGFQHFDDVWCSSDGVNWQCIVEHAPWGERAMHQSVVFNDRLWVIGGGQYDTAYPNNIKANYADVWSTADGVNWVKECDAPWAARRFHASVVYDDKMWVIAGYGDTGNLNDVWFSEDGVNWQQQDPFDVPWPVRHEPMCLVFDDILWLMGGNGLNCTLYNDVWTYMAP